MEKNSVVTVADRLERLSAYDVTPEKIIINSRSASGLMAFDIEPPSRASVVGDAILSFVSGMSDQNRADVLNTYLFASLAANKKYPADHQGKEWYQIFLTVMQDAGWTIKSRYYDSTSASGKSFTMDQLALKILSSAVAAAAVPGPTSALLLKVAGDAMASLQSSDKPLKVFDQNIKDKGTGGFAVGSCLEIDGQEVILTLGSVRFINHTNQTKVLFVNWDSSSVDLYRGESHMTMVPSIIERTRAIIAGKLGDRAVKQISEWEI
ncbi:hypothetical protein CFN16_02520 [Pseudomonas fluorescens]|uniref:Uncharacterized protein n=1 Tax=Pseudomonas fluorescens TaxID=294 RepID=A0A345URE3_PSEFL|nr:hypothetical protein [Pseudomonas fluorescens]AXJ03045.1 hypothetical protein CFN16_02520 [Pseudomonas fluorescens]WJK10585.1 hypothetical protein QR290_04380 [Pseudomonas fluorescens]